jgi:hypothetical protein
MTAIKTIRVGCMTLFSFLFECGSNFLTLTFTSRLIGMLQGRRKIAIPEGSRIYCPGCFTEIGVANTSIYQDDIFESYLFDFTDHIFDEDEEPECVHCQTPWLSEDEGIFTEHGWYPHRH